METCPFICSECQKPSILKLKFNLESPVRVRVRVREPESLSEQPTPSSARTPTRGDSSRARRTAADQQLAAIVRQHRKKGLGVIVPVSTESRDFTTQQSPRTPHLGSHGIWVWQRPDEMPPWRHQYDNPPVALQQRDRLLINGEPLRYVATLRKSVRE